MRRGDENIHHSTHSIKRRVFDHFYYGIYNSKIVNDYKTPSADIQKMLDITRNQKHKTILSILYGCGLRRNEIIELKIKDIDLNAKTITVYGKGDKLRIVPIGKKLEQQISLQYTGSSSNTSYITTFVCNTFVRERN